MGNTVYAWDAATGELLWKTDAGNADPTERTAIDSHNINVKWGILSTPVIDRAAGVLYACAWISSDKTGKWQTGQHFVAALDIVTGRARAADVSLEDSIQRGRRSARCQQFHSMERKQRSALAIVNGAVIVCFGTIAETTTRPRAAG